MDFKKWVGLLLILCTLHSIAQTPNSNTQSNWMEREYGYFAQEESLRNLLYDFASSISIPIIISQHISASVSGNFPSVKAKDFLSNLSKVYQLTWVFDGTTLYVYDLNEIESQIIQFPFGRSETFQRYFKELNIEGSPLDWKFIPSQNIIQVSGPPRFNDLIQDLADRVRAAEVDDDVLPATPHGSASPRTYADMNDYRVRVFYIKYGYVDTGINSTSGSKQPVVNLASMIGKIMNVSHIAEVEHSSGGNPQDRLLGSGLVPSAPNPPNTAAASSAPTRPSPRKSEAYIIGDPRLNAIVVRDLAGRMHVYENLIRELDKPLDQVEIEVTILDVDTNEAENIGISFASRNINYNPRSGSGGNNFTYTTAVNAEAIRGIVANIIALESEGKGRILSRPSVLTLDNHEAQFQNNQTFYVSLGAPDAGGGRSAAVDLVPVTYGSNMKVRPHVIYEGGERKIQMAIYVEDGRRTGAGADGVLGVPEISRNIIQTQAVVKEGQSLLVGGYVIRTNISSDQRIPILGYIPVVGLAFSHTVDRQSSIVRYFAITPRIIDTSVDYKITTGFEDIDSLQRQEGSKVAPKKKSDAFDRTGTSGPP